MLRILFGTKQIKAAYKKHITDNPFKIYRNKILSNVASNFLGLKAYRQNEKVMRNPILERKYQ